MDAQCSGQWFSFFGDGVEVLAMSLPSYQRKVCPIPVVFGLFQLGLTCGGCHVKGFYGYPSLCYLICPILYITCDGTSK